MKLTRILATLLFVTLAVNARAVPYNAAADFQTVSNPLGVWSYSYSLAGGLSYAPILFDEVVGSTWLSSTNQSFGTPSATKNNEPYTVNGVASGQFALHPGPDTNIGAFAILRFTTANTDTYQVTGQFYAGDTGSMNGAIVLNGNHLAPLQYFANTTDTSFFSPLSLTLTAGDTLDFVVGFNGDFVFGSTPLDVNIDIAAPEPASIAILLGGLTILGVARSRREP